MLHILRPMAVQDVTLKKLLRVLVRSQIQYIKRKMSLKPPVKFPWHEHAYGDSFNIISSTLFISFDLQWHQEQLLYISFCCCHFDFPSHFARSGFVKRIACCLNSKNFSSHLERKFVSSYMNSLNSDVWWKILISILSWMKASFGAKALI